MGLRCEFCGKDWVQSCWTKQEAWICGNNDGSLVPKCEPPPLPKALQRQIDAVEAKRAALLAKAAKYRALKS